MSANSQNPLIFLNFRSADNAPATKAGIAMLGMTSMVGWFLLDGETRIGKNLGVAVQIKGSGNVATPEALGHRV